MRKMSITVENSYHARPDDEAMNQRAHFIPSHISADGEAHVQDYFEPYVTTSENGDLIGTLRGRPLDGTEMKLPPGHSAVVITEARRPLSEEADRKFQVSGGFKELMYWNYDKRPSKNDALVKAMDWIDIAEAMHGD